MSFRASGVVLLCLVALPAMSSGQPQAAGGEFRVNTYTTQNQLGPGVAMDTTGNFVVVWQSFAQDGHIDGVFGKRYDATGAPQGAEFRVNTYTTSTQEGPAVAMDAIGNFVVVWDSRLQDGSGAGIFGQRYAADGSPRGSEFQVNTYTPGYQFNAAVAMDAGGNFVVVWDGPLSDVDVVGRRYDAGGVAQGDEFRVNTYTTDDQVEPAVGMDAIGNFVVVWRGSYHQDGSYSGIFGQRYDAGGLPRGAEFQVNSYTPKTQVNPAVAMDPSGNFVVVWHSDTQDGDSLGVFGQRYDATGVPRGSEFRVNTHTTDYQGQPRVASDPFGNFVVVWTSNLQDGSSFGVFGQRYAADGSPRGSEFQVNTYATNSQGSPAVAMDAVGNFVVVWTSVSQDGDLSGVFGQRYGGLYPAALAVDLVGNGVLEPGETVFVLPAWRNVSGGPLSFAGAASDLTGPAGSVQLLVDPAAAYGTTASGATGSCTDCYQVLAVRPSARPTLHWDLTVRETIGPPATFGQTKVWTLHVGESFADVPPAHPFYRFIETLLHVGVTAGCTATTYCPDGSTTREQMAVFLLRAREGGNYTPPPCTTAPFPDVPCSSPFAAWVRELVTRGITAGCGGGLYCPTDPVTREQMAVFLLKTREGAAFTPPACTTATFSDVPCTSPFAPWVQELVVRGITAGCAAGLYCPTDPVTRAQMAVFLTKTFGLALYGP
jgi:hypothetical protein